MASAGTAWWPTGCTGTCTRHLYCVSFPGGRARQLTERYRLSYWDSAILAAARTAGCDTVLSEDLSAGQDYDGVRIVNPFA